MTVVSKLTMQIHSSVCSVFWPVSERKHYAHLKTAAGLHLENLHYLFLEWDHQPWVRKSGNISWNISELISVSMFPHSDFRRKIDHVVTIYP